MLGPPVRYESRPLFYPLPWPRNYVAIYPFALNEEHPLTFVCGREFEIALGWREGTQLRPMDMETDQASVPILLQIIYPKDLYLGPYIHDAGYNCGGVMIKYRGDPAFMFTYLKRSQLDIALSLMVGSEGGNDFDRWAFYKATHVGGRQAWDRHDDDRPYGADE